MRRFGAIAVSGAAALLWASEAHAASNHQQPSHRVQLRTTTFSLAVTGTPNPGTTFWVSHGPLGGRFGVIRLRPTGNHVYSARATLPANGVTSFTYLAAQGTQLVHGTPQPGGTVSVIRTLDSVTAAVASRRIVHWSVPLG